jgi:ankyrin repeat protein
VFFSKTIKKSVNCVQNRHRLVFIVTVLVSLTVFYCGLSSNYLEFSIKLAKVSANKRESIRQNTTLIGQQLQTDSLQELNENVLMDAAQEGNIGLVTKCLAEGIDVNATNFGGWTPLMFACDGRPDAIETLLNAGAKINIKNKNGSTPLMLAANRGLTNVVKTLVMVGAKLDEKENDGSTALLLAARACNWDIVTYLVLAGANVSIANQYGSTPLIEVSSCSNSPHLINFLLESGADINAKTADGRTALAHAAI